jgi:predicted PurR-regulated permease PerM
VIETFILLFLVIACVLLIIIASNQVQISRFFIQQVDMIKKNQVDLYSEIDRRTEQIIANQEKLIQVLYEIKGEKNETYRRNE